MPVRPLKVSQQPPPHGLDTEVKITVFDSFDSARSDWERIEALGENYAFQSLAWLSAWHDTCESRPGRQLCIVYVEHAEKRPLMLLPLAIEKQAGSSCLVWLGGALTDYQAPILGPSFVTDIGADRFRSLWETIRQMLPPHNAVFFEKQPEYVGSQKNPFTLLDCTPHASSAHLSHLDGDFDTFIAKTRSKKSLSTERRKRKKLERHGTISFVVANESGEAKQILSTLVRQKSESYRDLGVIDLLAMQHHRDFIERLSTDHLGDGFVHLSALKMNDEFIAVHWGLVYKKRLYYLLPSYERGELERLSPGNYLLHRLLEWCFDNGVSVCDFTVGDEPYKLQWRDTELQLFDLMKSDNLSGNLYILPLRIKRSIKFRIKRSPALLKFLYAWRSRLARLARVFSARVAR